MNKFIRNKNIFNSAAHNYDELFTHSTIGRLQRKRVYHWLNKINFFEHLKNVFEINCGTGNDAEEFFQKGHTVIATDGSDKMIEYAKSNRDKSIVFSQLEFSQVTISKEFLSSDVLFSNFGGLNCIDNSELREFANSIAEKQKKKDLLIWVLMPRFCLLETLYFLLKLDFKRLFRRNTSDGVEVKVDETSVQTYYHSPKEVKDMLKQNYNILKIKPVAIFLPPSYMEPFFNKRKKLLGILNELEMFFGKFTFLAAWSDHYIIIAEKK